MKSAPVPGLILLLSAGLLHGASHDAHQHALEEAPPEQLGEVSFPVSCNQAAQAEFNRAMALFHSFWFGPARQSFATVLEHDASCVLAHWGIAMMSMGNPFGWPARPEAQDAAAAALAAARESGAGSERERGLIEALGRYLDERARAGHRERIVAFEQAMGELAASFPEDTEIQILHALVLNAAALPTDKSFARQLKAAAILEPLLARYPDHPGVAHYLIHTYDYAELAERALPAARVYASIAPSVPHALHMPTHTFSRLGLWPEMVEGNYASLRAAEAELGERSFGPGVYDALHALDYLVFGHLQQAQDQAARTLVEQVAGIREIDVRNFVAAYAFAAIPARYALERGDWAEAASLELSPAELAWERFPQAEAILVFARGLGAARSADLEGARRDRTRLEQLYAAMSAGGEDYWAAQTAFQIRAVSAWIALAEGAEAEALKLMQQAAAAEDATDKHPVTPGNVLPARVLLGEMLLQLERPVEALAEFERSLERDPARFRAVWGAAKAAQAAGQTAIAERHYQALLEIAAASDTDRPELQVARTALSR